MSSTKWPGLFGPDAAAIMIAAVSAVAERSFFAVAEPCDEPRFAALAEGAARWIVGAVGFTESDCSGTVTCTMSKELVDALFDAFTGRGPLDPAPGAEQIDDLVGEFSNMVCGTWLTRLATAQKFTLTRPRVGAASKPTERPATAARLLLAINDMPLAVEVRMESAAGV